MTQLKGPLNPLITEYMHAHGIQTVKDLADRLGIQRTALYELLRERPTTGDDASYPSVRTLIQLARGLGRPTHELLYAFAPDAPGAPDTPLTEDPRESARARLRARAEGLPDTDTFLQQRRASHGEGEDA